MAGVYVHIPFCKSRCKYCDFYSTTLLDKQVEYVEALKKEWNIRRHELLPNSQKEIGTDIATLYIGGGTPSTMDAELIGVIRELIIPSSILDQQAQTTPEPTNDSPEITMEANPGDLSLPYLRQLRAAGINRLSIGIQSFQDRLLSLIGRRHTAAQAIEAVQNARQAGFENISIDLIYGLPTQTMDEWKTDIETALSLQPEHISCYCLSYEEDTPLSRMLERGEIEETDEDTENEMYDYLSCRLKECGYEHYEVSNYAKPGYYSRHNSSYWNDTPYLGLGAGAHSYDGLNRSSNKGDIATYIQNPASVHETEILTNEDRYNEHIMLSLRTMWGLSMDYISAIYRPYIMEECQRGNLEIVNGNIRATQQGLHILNRIIENLMI